MLEESKTCQIHQQDQLFQQLHHLELPIIFLKFILSQLLHRLQEVSRVSYLPEQKDWAWKWK